MSSVLQPPPFQEGDSCQACKASFGLITRRHHCRNCGKSFCSSHASKYISLPHFGLNSDERVCSQCYDLVAIEAKKRIPGMAAQAPARSEEKEAQQAVACTCGMPLCSCQAKQQKAKEKEEHDYEKKQATVRPASPKREINPKSQFGHFSGFSSKAVSSVKYDLKGDLNEQCREAIKSSDSRAVKALLDAKATVDYIDRSGNTFCHLACLFDKWDMVKLIADHGGNPYMKNQRNETAVFLAPVSLQHKIKAAYPEEKYKK